MAAAIDNMSSQVKKVTEKRKLNEETDKDPGFFDEQYNMKNDANDLSDTSDSEESIFSELDDIEGEESDSGKSVSTDESSLENSEENSKDDDAEEEDLRKEEMKKDNTTIVTNVGSWLDSKNMPEVDEYEEDSSDEEDIRNTVGNIPLEWYNDYPHIGYDWRGRKIVKPATGDELDKFLDKMDNPDYWRTVKDRQTGQSVILSDQDLDIVQQIQAGKYPDVSYNPYEPWVDFFSHDTMVHPVTRQPEHKRSFIPSKIEKEKVSKILHAIKMGWIKPRVPKDETAKFYDLWKDGESSQTAAMERRLKHHIPAPKLMLPGHEESYNPPPEYLLTPDEVEAWENQEPETRKINFIPKKYPHLRSVPAYTRFINDRFERCLDLYLCPRQRKMRVHVRPEDLIPKLPKPRDLQPFPTICSIVYIGHEDFVRCISVEPTGQFFASGSDDRTIRIWEVATGRCLKTLQVEGTVKDISWCPNSNLCLVAAAINSTVVLLNPGTGDKLLANGTDATLKNSLTEGETKDSGAVVWKEVPAEKYDTGFRLTLEFKKEVSKVTWHSKGDYFATVEPQAGDGSVMLHQLSRRRSQNPFRKSKGLVQSVLFHPTRPYLFVATQRYVRVYNLLKQELTKKLLTNCKWVSSIAIHPKGDNVIIGSYDCRLGWFDLDLSTKPYQTLRHHKKAIRQVSYHKRYPLFASASDDGTVIVCHGMVYADLLQNPLIVPVKILRGHKVNKALGVLDCMFHPTQPWLLSAGADHTVRLFT
ncbi:PREDICTED: ribosome biogenesis protein bop1-A-like [Priapulus caudatus]|uniref:Ribosome biogenesis protein BOP1 homolog n=1 Tax=Priapulus caudatus TaxID=37621 RepID=A0ABM1DWN3_PRICU|nr:PREDICTED: ribosome biogenesis protein bop1-A-like [Priapulus caudatus]